MDKNDEIRAKLFSIAEATEVKVDYVQDESDQNKLRPAFNIDGMVSKFIALLVYSGLNVPVSFAPSYTNVHADIEFWKKRFEASAEKIEPPAEPSEKPAEGEVQK